MSNNFKVLTVCLKFSLPILLLLMLGFSQSFAQGKGNIKGLVLDKDNGEPIIGANVLIENTNIGAATDL
ncbi:MAG: carboxypeptidase-like regulatory domain-containing protein, partial [Ignavibacterium sp.]|nr:carboxypeptidase-like regulatory domain-containing protein [Ignavibacterium sp.]